MMRLHRTSMIATLAVLAWAATASAECAWVLWRDHEILVKGMPWPQKEWKAESAHKAQKECETVLTAVSQVEAKHSQPGPDNPGILDVTSEPGFVSIRFKPKDADDFGGYSNIRYRCFPDTVDPRGPKGK